MARDHRGLWLALPAAVLIAGVFALATPVLATGNAKQCWSPADLRTKPGDATIRKGIRAAYLPVPTRPPRKLAPLPAHLRGVIRRVNLPKGDKRVALTFDLCEQPYEISGYQGGIVDYLREQNIPATFFAGGKWLLTHTRRATQLMADPAFEIANHSWEHRNHRLISGRTLARAIDGAQSAYEITRDKLKASACLPPDTPESQRSSTQAAFHAVPQSQKLFRFPFGACNATSLKAVNDRGLMIIQWDVSSADPWRGMTADKMVDHVVRRTKPGSILLFHANGRGWNTGAALPRIITALRARGFTFDTVGGLLATPGAQPVIAQTCYDAKPGDSERYDKVSRRLIERYNQFYRKIGAKPPSTN